MTKAPQPRSDDAEIDMDQDHDGEAKPAERRYGGRTADERRAERRRRLLASALELFGGDGYARTGIERLCSHAGVTARHFYEEFGSREGLLHAVYDEVVTDCIDAVASAVAAAPPDAEPLIRAGLHAFVHAMLDDPRRARISCLEVVGVSPALEAHRRDVLRLYADLVRDQALTVGLGRDAAPRALSAAAFVLVGGTNELVIEWLTDGGTYTATIDDLIDDLLLMYLAVGHSNEASVP